MIATSTAIGIVVGVAFMGIFLAAFISSTISPDGPSKIGEIEEKLPHLDCGVCGYPKCSVYAQAIVKENVEINKCSPGGNKAVEEIAILTDRSMKPVISKKAYIRQITPKTRVKNIIPEGIASCQGVADLFGDQLPTAQPCVGFRDCGLVCNYRAVRRVNEKVYVDHEKCVGCGICLSQCPFNLVQMKVETVSA